MLTFHYLPRQKPAPLWIVCGQPPGTNGVFPALTGLTGVRPVSVRYWFLSRIEKETVALVQLLQLGALGVWKARENLSTE